jgi:hypothetical protein
MQFVIHIFAYVLMNVKIHTNQIICELSKLKTNKIKSIYASKL